MNDIKNQLKPTYGSLGRGDGEYGEYGADCMGISSVNEEGHPKSGSQKPALKPVPDTTIDGC